MRMQQRDLEMLRTLARLQFVSSVELVNAFFPSPKAGLRRLKKLGDLELIARHTKGATLEHFFAWRLTKRGIAALVREYPNEPIQEGFDERLTGLNLGDGYDRGVFNELYLALVCDRRGPAEMGSSSPGWQELRKWTAAVRLRASAIEWNPRGSLCFEWRNLLGQTFRLMPDATVVNRAERFFLELDQSQRPRSRIEEQLRLYAGFLNGPYTHRYRDGKRAVLVFLAHSEARRDQIYQIAQALYDGPRGKVKALVVSKDATTWLAKTLLGEQRSELDRDGSAPFAERQAVTPPAGGAGGTGDDLCVGCALANGVLRATEDAFGRRELEPSANDNPRVARWKQSMRELHEYQGDSPRNAGGAT